MYTIDRSVVIIRPKKPYAKWANNCAMGEGPYTVEYYENRSIAVLIPHFDAVTAIEAKRYVNRIWDDIFVEHLNRWTDNTLWWPTERTRKMFGEWFKVEYHFVAVDSL